MKDSKKMSFDEIERQMEKPVPFYLFEDLGKKVSIGNILVCIDIIISALLALKAVQ
ncbi:hypothetical protein LI177_02725 [bacterium 210820-DFI.6.37]|nr:hypothetical protein [bacterium 210820-DFI.6.37]